MAVLLLNGLCTSLCYIRGSTNDLSNWSYSNPPMYRFGLILSKSNSWDPEIMEMENWRQPAAQFESSFQAMRRALAALGAELTQHMCRCFEHDRYQGLWACFREWRFPLFDTILEWYGTNQNNETTTIIAIGFKQSEWKSWRFQRREWIIVLDQHESYRIPRV